ncbi:MAG: protocatechuate 3,4-dioxygenase subunit alpha [Pseudomonadota bacterium]
MTDRPNTKKRPETASQTAGPYVHIGLSPKAAGFEIYENEAGKDIAGPHAQGERVRVEGIVWDGNGDPVKDVLIEVWQPDAQGRFAHRDLVEDGFRGWGRIISDFDTGEWDFETVRPGAVEGGAPHLDFWIVARGINIGLHTRMYFPDVPGDLDADPVLAMLAPEERATLVAQRQEPAPQAADGAAVTYRFDIRLQGAGETVFFDV